MPEVVLHGLEAVAALILQADTADDGSQESGILSGEDSPRISEADGLPAATAAPATTNQNDAVKKVTRKVTFQCDQCDSTEHGWPVVTFPNDLVNDAGNNYADANYDANGGDDDGDDNDDDKKPESTDKQDRHAAAAIPSEAQETTVSCSTRGSYGVQLIRVRSRDGNLDLTIELKDSRADQPGRDKTVYVRETRERSVQEPHRVGGSRRHQAPKGERRQGRAPGAGSPGPTGARRIDAAPGVDFSTPPPGARLPGGHARGRGIRQSRQAISSPVFVRKFS